MLKQPIKSSLYLVLFVAFIDFMGVGLVYPLFSSMIFDTSIPLLPSGTSPEMRGFWLGLLLALMPMAQFFGSPVWGTMSDNRGRKKPLGSSLSINILGYLIGFFGVIFNQLFLLLASRIIVGFASGNMSIVQATISDISSMKTKAKNFSLYAMAMGAGFTLGPFLGGTLSTFGNSTPFVFAILITLLNLLLVFFFFKETHHPTAHRKIKLHEGIFQLKKAFQFKGLRTILLCSFLYNFGWSYFFEFTPVYLISAFKFSTTQLGYFFAAAGGYYALSSGLLIRPFLHRFKPETLFFAGNFFGALFIFSLPLFLTPFNLWILLFFISYFVAFIMPSAITFISNHASPQIQGEALGVFGSVNAAAFAISPLLSGSFVGEHPTVSMWVGGSFLLLAALIVLGSFRGKLNPHLHLED